MRIKSGFALRSVCGETIVVAEGEENLDFSQLVSLNESAAYLWQKVVGRDFDEQVLADLLVAEYDVDCQTALSDAHDVVWQWRSLGVAE